MTGSVHPKVEDMQHYRAVNNEEGLEIRATLGGRLAAAAVRFAVWTPLGMAGLSVLFLPDYLGQYRQDEPVTGLFWAALAGLAVFAGLIAAGVRLMRRDIWLLSPDRDAIVFATQPLVGRTRESHIDWSELTSVDWRPRGFGRSSTLSFQFEGHPEETVASTRLGAEPIAPMFDKIKAFLAEHRPDVEVRTHDPDSQHS
jgi:hypothetical protein